MPFTEVNKTGSGTNLEKEKVKFIFGHAKFKMPMRHPWGDVKRAVDYARLQLREEVWIRDTNLESMGIELVFKAIRMDVITAPHVSVLCTDVLQIKAE